MAGKNRTAFQSRWLGGALQLCPPVIAGSAFFVDNTNGSNSNSGTHWDNAFSTLNYAVSKCTAGAGDGIYLAPWHAETIEDTGTASGTTTDECVIDKEGVSIIGLGHGEFRPTFTLEGATDAAIVVVATGIAVRISNIIIESNLADVAAGITLSATSDGSVIDHCDFRDGAAAKELVIGISVAAACDNISIINNRFTTVPAGGCASGIKLAGESARSIITGNYIQGDYSASCIDGTTAAATLLTVSDNYLINIDTTAGSCIDMHANTTGMSCNNRMMGGKSIADCWIANGMVSVENYATGAVSASGLVEPAVDGD
jgi:hypothetical protein